MAAARAFSELDELRRLANQVFTDFDRWRWPFTRYSFLPGRAARMYPLINISEDAEAFYIEALAPGIKPENLKVSVLGQQLTIEGEKTASATEVSAESIHRSERAAGNFIRTIELPRKFSADGIKAEYLNGVLTISAPKSAEAKPKTIMIQQA